MKTVKALLGVWIVGVLCGLLTLSTAFAQDFSIWNGKWFKLSVKHSGYYINPSGLTSPYKEAEVAYLKVLNMDEANKAVDVYLFSYKDGEWRGNAVAFNYLGGNSLDFLWYFDDRGKSDSGLGFTARVQGKTKGGALTTASLKSLAGFEWDLGRGRTGGVGITGSLVPESKLPPDLPIPPDIQFNSLEFPFLTPANIERLAAFGTPNWSGSEPHNGIDLIIYESLSSSKIISPLKGMVQSIKASENSYSNPPNQLMLTVEIFVNAEWTVALVFEPGTVDDATKAAQMSAIKVQIGQIVEAGQEIGDLWVGELGYPHLHYMPKRNGQPVCAYTYSSDGARQIFDEIAARSSSGSCYQDQ